MIKLAPGIVIILTFRPPVRGPPGRIAFGQAERYEPAREAVPAGHVPGDGGPLAEIRRRKLVLARAAYGIFIHNRGKREGAALQAAVYYGGQDVRVQEWPEPEPPGLGEVQIAVSLAGICGTDLEEFLTGPHLIPIARPHPASGRVAPLVLGHEMVGRVVAVGDGCGSVRVGDRVVPGSGVWCGACRWCRAGRTNLCATYYTLGLHADGGLAELVNVPAKICMPVVDSPDEVAVLAQPLAVAMHAVRGCAARPGDVVTVVGAGGIGSLAIPALVNAGVSVIVVDIVPAVLRTAERLGATWVVHDDGGNDPAGIIRERTGGVGSDIVMESSGAPAGLRTAVRAVRRGGLIQLVGLHRDPSPLDLTRLVLDEIRMHTAKVHVCLEDLPAALAMLRDAPWIADVLVGPAINLAQLVREGFTRMASQQVTGKVIVQV
jgi:(R,R)-butanediol dehydrogenase/meso-butanediol dehydrogenase/diacetyl reductase